MRQHETNFWKQLNRAMRGRWHAQRHEDSSSVGIPDVSAGIGGHTDVWIELKALAKPPVRRFTPRIRVNQLNWLEKRGTAGHGACFVMTRVASRGPFIITPWNKAREFNKGVDDIDRVCATSKHAFEHEFGATLPKLAPDDVAYFLTFFEL